MHGPQSSRCSLLGVCNVCHCHVVPASGTRWWLHRHCSSHHVVTVQHSNQWSRSSTCPSKWLLQQSIHTGIQKRLDSKLTSWTFHKILFLHLDSSTTGKLSISATLSTACSELSWSHFSLRNSWVMLTSDREYRKQVVPRATVKNKHNTHAWWIICRKKQIKKC